MMSSVAKMGNSAVADLEVAIPDPVVRFARGLLYLSLFFSSLLVLRIGAFTVGDFLLVASIALTLVARSLNRIIMWTPPFYRVEGTAVILMLFMLGAAPAVSNAASPGESLSVIARLLLVALVLPWTCRQLLPTRIHLARAAGWLAAGAALTASGTLLQFALGRDVIPGAAVTDAGRFSGFTGHVSDMGGVATLGIAVSIGLALFARRARSRFWALAATALLAAALILSGSVSGMIATAVAVAIFTVRRAMKLRHVLLVGLLGAGALAIAEIIQEQVAALSPLERLMQTLGLSAQGQYSTSEIRTETYSVAIDKFLASPVMGSGFDPVSSIADGVFPAHNIVIAALFQGGLLFTLALAALATRPVRGRWLRKDTCAVTTTLLAAMGAATAFAMTAPSLYNRYFWIPVAFLGVAQALSRVPSEPTRRVADASRHL